MSSQHLIEEAHVELAFASEAEAGSQQAVLSDFVNSKLLREVDEIFNEQTEADSVLRIEHLEVDLGVVPFRDYQDEMVVRLRERLRDRLRDLKFRARHGESSEAALTPTATTEFEVVEAILRNGYLPWHSRFYSVDEMRRLFMRVVKLQHVGVIRLLVSTPDRSAAYERLGEILPLEGLLILANSLYFRGTNELSSLLDRLVDFHFTVASLKSISGMTRSDALHDLWKVVVELLIYSVDTRRNTALLMMHLFRRCGADHNTLSEQIRNYLIEQRLEGFFDVDGLTLAGDSRQEAEPVADLMRPHVEAVEAKPVGDNTAGFSRLAEWLSTGEDAGVKRISVHWRQLLEQYPQPLATLFRTHGGRVEVRRVWVQHFSSVQLAEIVGLLEATAPGFVASTVRHFSDFSHDNARLSARQGAGGRKSGNDEKLLWEFTFDFIFIERGNRFNKKAYCGSLLREMAAHNNRAYGDLLGEMLQWLLSHVEQSSVMAEMLSIIGELSDHYAASGITANGVDREELSSDAEASLCDEITAFLSSRDEQRRRKLTGILGDAHRAHTVATSIDVTQFEQLLDAVIGERYREFSQFAAPLMEAVEHTQVGIRRELVRREYLLCCCRYLIDAPPITPSAFVQRLADRLLSLSSLPVERFYPDLLYRLRQVSTVSGEAVAETIRALRSTAADLVQMGDGKDGVGAFRQPEPNYLAENTLRTENPIYITNAGQVLLAPYFPVLFSRMGLLEGDHFVDLVAPVQAVAALQYLVDGIGDAPEYLMVLNKLLCGIESRRPMPQRCCLDSDQKALVDSLLTAAIENWHSIGETSPAGLRESFLQREGRLELNEEKWRLQVESRSYDMLLDRLPWSFSTIKFAWMPRAIHVEWR